MVMNIYTLKDESLIFVEGNSSDTIELRNLLVSPNNKVVSFIVKIEDLSINADRQIACYTKIGKEILTWEGFLNFNREHKFDFVYDVINNRFLMGAKLITAGQFSLGGPMIRFLAESKCPQSTGDIARALNCSTEDSQASIRQAKKRLNEKVNFQIISNVLDNRYRLNPDLTWAVLKEHTG